MIRISDAEFEVMKVIWKRNEATSLQIIDDLEEFNWKFNTVRTLIKRLQKKGAIEVVGRNGKAYTYKSTIDQNEYKKEMAKDLIKRLYNNSINEFVLDYCSDSRATCEKVREQIRQTIEYIDKKEKEENKK